MNPWIEFGPTALGGKGFNVWLVFFSVESTDSKLGHLKQEFHEIPLLEQNTTYDKAREKALSVGKDNKLKVYHCFGKERHLELIQ